MTDELRGRLRESAEAHRPDRARMLARVERGAVRPDAGRRPRDRARVRFLSWPKTALATLATAGTLAVSALAVVAVVHTPDPPRNPTAAAPSGAPSAAAPSAAPSATAPSAAAPSAGAPSATAPSPGAPSAAVPSASAPPASSPSAPAPSAPARTAQPMEGSRTEDGPLRADGSVDPHSNAYWAQSNVTLTTRKPLSSLVVELRIALTEGVKDTGSWRTRPAADFDVSARREGGFLVYRWTLKPGRTVPSGEHVFAGQYDHAAGGRDAKGDRYRIDAAAGPAEPPAAVWGGFA
ncbi:hypothetical protein ACFWUW_05940 [Streptomyces sp. NPDC058655]|uniref:hypothetical protein n=1 Tax=Streptomyces sp. NPDC058655 TaxID=3346577 RepID=UPI003646007A